MNCASQKWTMAELNRFSTIQQAVEGHLTVREAAVHLGLSERQVYRMKKAFLKDGVSGIRHRNKAKAPSNKIADPVRRKILEVFLDWRNSTDEGINSSHLKDILEKDHGIVVSRQTCWRILKESSFFVRTRRVRKHRKKRNRREQEGDILYLDGSPHRWLGEHCEKITLLLCTDDATSKALWAIFVKDENRNGCFEVALEVFRRYGVPRSFWLDRASQFITTRGEGVVSKQTPLPTHWQNAMYHLGVRLIFAHSPQARGRGERANGTFQDRLAAELQYNKITDMTSANKYMQNIFIPAYNSRFSVEASGRPAWRPAPEGVDLRCILSARTIRKVLNDNTVKSDGIRYQLLPIKGVRSFARDEVEVQEWYDGSMHVMHRRYGDLPHTFEREPRHDNQLYHLTKSLKQRPDGIAET